MAYRENPCHLSFSPPSPARPSRVKKELTPDQVILSPSARHICRSSPTAFTTLDAFVTRSPPFGGHSPYQFLLVHRFRFLPVLVLFTLYAGLPCLRVSDRKGIEGLSVAPPRVVPVQPLPAGDLN